MSRLKTQKLGVYGGVNKKLSPHALPDDTSPSMDNFLLRATGPEKSKGWSKYTSQQFTDGKASPTTSTILRIVQFFKADGTVLVIAFTNHRAYFFRNSNLTWIPFSQGNNASTTVNVTSNSGQKVLSVASTTGYAKGDGVIINEGGPRQETAVVSSISAGVSLTMVSNLTFTHTAAQADVVRRTYEAARVNVNSASGQKILNVDFTDQFTSGEMVLINLGGGREEYATIASVQAGVSLTMVSNLTFTHTAAQNDKVYRLAELSYQNGTATTVDSDVANNKIYFTVLIDNVNEWDGSSSFSTDVANLNNVQGLAGGTRVRCKYLRSFQNFLVIGYLNEGGTTLPTKIRWSRFGDFETWANNTDGSGQAGFATFIGPDFIEGIRQMKQELFFYRDRNVEGMTFVGVPDIFDFRRVAGQGEQATGLVGNDALEDFSDFHGFLGSDNIWVNNGISQVKIGDPIKDDLFVKLNPSNRTSSKVFWDKTNDEMIVAFPTGNSTLCDKAYVYSFQFSKWSGPRDFNATALGRAPNVSSVTWDSLVGSWDQLVGSWDQTASNFPLILMGSNDGFIYQLDAMDTKNGTQINASYRTKVTDCGIPEFVKRLEKVYVGMREDDGTTINVYVGSAMYPGDSITWSNAMSLTLTAGSEPFVYPDITARYFQVRIDAISPANVRDIELFFIPGKFK